MRSRSLPPLCSLLLALSAGTGLAQEEPLPGRRAGTEQWLVCLRDRSYSLEARLQEIRRTTSASQRATMLNELRDLAATDQAAVATLACNAGGEVLMHFWVRSALAVEVPPAAVEVLRGHPRVRAVLPVRAFRAGDAAAGVRGPSAGVPPPIGTSTDA